MHWARSSFKSRASHEPRPHQPPPPPWTVLGTEEASDLGGVPSGRERGQGGVGGGAFPEAARLPLTAPSVSRARSKANPSLPVRSRSAARRPRS